MHSLRRSALLVAAAALLPLMLFVVFQVGFSARPAADDSFDLVLVDYQMPAMNGAEVIVRARTLQPALKFLLVTGFADSAQVAAALPRTPILHKPFSGDELLARVEAEARA